MLRLLVLALFLVPTAAAQVPLDVDVNTIWNQYTNAEGCCRTFGSTLKDDPRFSGGGNYGTGANTHDGTFTWSYPLDPVLDRIVHLDPAGTIDATVHIGGSPGTTPYLGSGRVAVTTQLLLGEEIVAQSEAKTINFVSAQAFTKVSWTMTPQLDTLDPALGNLVWSVTAKGAYSGMFLSHTDAQGNGWLSLPITGVTLLETATGPVYANLTEPSVELAFANATSATHIYNLTGTLETGRLQLESMGAGNVTVQLVDGANTVVADVMLQGNATQEIDFTGAVPGNWTLTVAFEGFTGTFSAGIRAMPETPLVPGDPEQPDAPADNGTLPPTQKESPLPALLPALGVALLAARRRR